MSNSKVTLLVHINAMKAFDTVNHNILINILKFYGNIGNCAKWVKNYLYNRQQCTVANNVTSQLVNITCGVPQGSLCRPLLFFLYINDIVWISVRYHYMPMIRCYIIVVITLTRP